MQIARTKPQRKARAAGGVDGVRLITSSWHPGISLMTLYQDVVNVKFQQSSESKSTGLE